MRKLLALPLAAPAAAAHVILQQENSGYPVFEVTL